MLKRLAIAALLTAGLHGQAARAGEVDMSTITCKELLSSSQEEVSYILMWIHGYYGGKSDDTRQADSGADLQGRQTGWPIALQEQLGHFQRGGPEMTPVWHVTICEVPLVDFRIVQKIVRRARQQNPECAACNVAVPL